MLEIFDCLDTLSQMLSEWQQIVFMYRLHCALYVIAHRFFTLFMSEYLMPIHLAASHLCHEFMDQLLLLRLLL